MHTLNFSVAASITLTENRDIISSTDGDDTYDASTEDTLNTNDIISDPSTSDNDTLNAVVTADLAPSPTIVKVENANVDLKGFDLEFNMADVLDSGVTVSSSQAGNGDANLTGIGAADDNLSITIDSSLDGTVDVRGDNATADVADITVGHDLTLNGAGNALEQLLLTASADSVVTWTAGTDIDNANDDNDITLNPDGNSLTLAGDQARFADLEIVDGSTGEGTSILQLTAAGSPDLSNVAVDVIDLNQDFAANTITAATGQSYKISANQTGTTTFEVAAADDSDSDEISLEIDHGTAGILDFDKANQDFETVNISATTDTDIDDILATGATVNLSGASNITVDDGNDGNTAATEINATGMTGNLHIEFDQANLDTIVGGEGDDAFIHQATAGSFSVTGNEGDDTLTLNVDPNGNTVTFDGGQGDDTLTLGAAIDYSADGTRFTLTDVDVIDLVGHVAEFDARDISGKTITLTNTGGNKAEEVDASQTTNIDLTNLTVNTAEIADLDITNVTNIGTTFKGSNTVDKITGGPGDDVFEGNADNDLLIGADGADTLTGGAGDDTFTYDAKSQSVDGTGVDTIKDFNADGAGTGDVIAFDANSSGTNLFASVGSTSAAFAGSGTDGLQVITAYSSASSGAFSYQVVGSAGGTSGIASSASLASAVSLPALVNGTSGFASGSAFTAALMSASSSGANASSDGFAAFALNTQGTKLFVATATISSAKSISAASVVMTLAVNTDNGAGISAASDIVLF